MTATNEWIWMGIYVLLSVASILIVIVLVLFIYRGNKQVIEGLEHNCDDGIRGLLSVMPDDVTSMHVRCDICGARWRLDDSGGWRISGSSYRWKKQRRKELNTVVSQRKNNDSRL